MLTNIFIYPAFFLIIMLGTHTYIIENSSAVKVMKQMLDSTADIKSMECRLEKKERMNGELKEQHSYMKLMVEPFKVYIRQLSPSQGMEILYVEGKHDNDAVINPNGFPWVNVWLDPMGERMRGGQHHNIYRSGFGYVMRVFRHIFDKHQDDLENYISMETVTKVNGMKSYKITYSSPDFYYYQYKVKKGETISSIADKMMISEYKIIEQNESIDSFNENIEEGQQLTLPSEYAKSLNLYIDTQRYIPLKIQVFDDKGLYEEYSYPEIRLNPGFNENTFSLENPEYGF